MSIDAKAGEGRTAGEEAHDMLSVARLGEKGLRKKVNRQARACCAMFVYRQNGQGLFEAISCAGFDDEGKRWGQGLVHGGSLVTSGPSIFD
jgi:hypothetical protein